MLLSLLPTAVFAAGETGTFTKITSQNELTDGKYVMVVDSGYAVGALDGTWLTATQITDEGGNITDPAANLIWNITVTEDGVTLTDANGVQVAPKVNDNGILAESYVWPITINENGAFQFHGIEGNDVTLASNKSSQNKFRAYKNATITNNPNGFPSNFTLYKLEGEGGGGTVTPPEEPETVTIAEALAAEDGTEGLAVKGVVTLIDGKNVYLQDDTGGICAYFDSAPSGISLGETIVATGKRDTFNGLPELASATYEVSSGLTLTPAVKTIRELATGDICTYVTIRNVEVTEVYDKNGEYSSPNITVTDGTSSIQLYKAVVGGKNEDGTWPVKEGDVITITGAVGVYDGNLQLRNTLISEIKVKKEVVDPITVDMVPEGVKTIDQVTADDKGVSVIGQVVYHYGNPYQGSESINSIILEDVIDGEIVGFQVYDYTNYNSYKVGDIVKVTGDVSVYGGVLQMSMPAMEVLQTGVDPIPAQQITISEMGAEYLSEYVYIDGITLGTYNASGNTTVTDSTGTGNLYKGAPLPSGAVTALYACCSAYNGTYQLRNGRTADYVAEGGSEPSGDITFPDSFVIYNVGAQGVLAGEGDNQVVNNAAATVKNEAATPTNGARVFTVEQNGEYYRFKTADGYLCSNGTGNNAFYSKNATNDADWTLTAGKEGGWNLESRTAKFNGQHSQYLEYYGGSYKTYSMYNVTDYDIYEFFFYPVAESVTVTDGVVNIPTVNFGTLSDAYVGRAYTVTFTVDSVFGVAEGLTATYGDTTAKLTNENGAYSFTIPGSAMIAGDLAITVSGADTKDVPFNASAEITVKDEPYILEVFPAASAQTGDDKQPEIGFTFGNAGENPTVAMTVNGTSVDLTVADGRASYTPAEPMADGKVTVTATVARKDGKSATKTWTFTIGEAQYQLYFGQLHSHTGEYSDGAGTLQEGLDYVARLPESANVDFVAFTDHSNYFDKSGEANPEAALYDVSQMTAYSQNLWNEYKSTVAAFNAEHAGKLVALAGFEMTWSGGPGHINTFNTPGIVSRNNSTLNNKTDDAGMKAYYKLLSNNELADSISQFNHPGTTFGNFSDFGYYDPVIDTRMYLVEVGNGEGAIGAGGYYPSYEQYIMALDKGWHLAPTNNQDNHKGKWGNANDARDVILTDDFTEAGIYEAIRNYRVYATEDKNLEINYTLNGEMLGSTIKEAEIANIQVSVHDPDDSDSISKVEVVVNSGAVAYTWDNPTELTSGELECFIPANYSYYFIRVTQGDGDLAVTAPVWIGEVVKLGVSSVECGTSTPVTGEALTLTTTLFNSESNPATVKSITYTSGSETLGTDTTQRTISASGTLAVDWTYTPTRARVMTVTVTVVLEEGGIEYTYSKDISLDIQDASKLVYIGIDASHYNEYVNGNYKDSMGNFGNLAAGYSVRTVQLNTSEDLIAACENESGKYKAIFLTAPSRRNGDALRDPYVCYSDEEIEALKAFNAAGGVLVLAGWSDYYESYEDFPETDHMAAQQNKVLAALGSSLRIGDDATNDNELNGGQTQRLYFSTYNWDNFLMDGVEFDAEYPNNNLYSQLFSQYGGASIYVVDDKGNPTTTIPDTVSPVVYGHASTYSKDSDGDGLGGNGMPKYAVAENDNRLMVLATEDLGDGKGLIIVSGAAFMSNFEVQATIGDSGAEKNYSNYNICENLVNYLNPATITPIKDVQAQKDEGIKYTIEGVVTSNASGFDKDTAFFDCIYVQDDTAGINAFPVAGSFKIGDVVRITGTTSSYQGERQLNVTSIKKIGETDPVASKSITTKEAAQSTYLGSLVKIQGVVVSFAEAEGLVQTIMVRDETGYDARVFIDGYITKDTAIENLAVGHEITVVGLASYDSSFDGPAPRIRVRDRADIVCGTEVVDIPPEYVEPENPPVNPPYTPDDDDDDDERSHSSVVISGGKTDTDIPDSDTPLSAGVFTDLDKGAWYYEAVSDVVDQGLMNGVSATSFAPGQTVSRAMLATVLYRMSGETWEGDPAGFPDVEPNTWYSAAADWANAVGVVKGYDTGLFGVNDDVTREQLVTMLYRYWLHLGGDGSAQADLTAFADGGSVSEYARPAMAWAVAQGLIQGRPGGLLAPAESTTRAELCTILVRFQALKA